MLLQRLKLAEVKEQSIQQEEEDDDEEEKEEDEKKLKDPNAKHVKFLDQAGLGLEISQTHYFAKQKRVRPSRCSLFCARCCAAFRALFY